MPEFHPEAAKALEAKAEDILREAKVQSPAPQKVRTSPANPIHPVSSFTTEDMIGPLTWSTKEVDGVGTETGRFWEANGRSVGWNGEAYQSAVKLALRFSKDRNLQGEVSQSFVLEELFIWLRQRLERNTTDTFCDRLLARCEAEVKDHEIWVPLHRTYARDSRAFGTTVLRPISKDLMDAWFFRFVPANDAVRVQRDRERSKLQATLAVCTSIRAEKTKAEEIAFERAIEASALLRFLSPANWSAKTRSYVVPLGMEKAEGKELLYINNGLIESTSSSAIDRGPTAWNLDEHVHHLPHLFGPLSALMSDHEGSQFRRQVHEGLLLYSKNSLTNEASEKLVFVLVALESIFLRNSSEPIQGNLAERIAFLIGETLEARKIIVTTTRQIYGLRSNFIHHGQSIEDNDLLEKFLWFAWESFAYLLQLIDKAKTVEELLSSLDDRRLA